MAFSSLRAQGQYGTTVSDTHIFLTPNVAIEVGDTICVAWDINVNNITVSSIADDSVQSGSANSYTVNTTRKTTAHSFGTAYCAKATRRILNTNTITITLSAAGTRRSGNLGAFVPGNGNPVFDQLAGVTADASSPVDYAATGTLAQADSLLVTLGGWRGGPVASGWDGYLTWSTLTGGLSGGSTARSEVNVAYNLNIGSASAVTISETYTSLTNAHGEVLVFNDVALATSRPEIIVVRRTWAGR